jgi:hypothetical protein
MPYILVIDKTGAIKETNIKEYKEADLYKKANFKSAEGFALQTVWTGLSTSSSEDKKTVSVAVYGKKAGKAGQENKYEFPPPIDSVLFFGGCVLVAKSESEVEGSIIDLRVSSWNKIYDTLMGGFEDLDLGDEEEEEEENEDDHEVQDPNLIGKNGYMKDGFVVEDDDVEFEEDREDLVEEEEEEDLVEDSEEEKPKKKPKRKPAEKKGDKDKKKKSMEKEGSMSDISVAVTDNYLDCSSELVEEAYV